MKNLSLSSIFLITALHYSLLWQPVKGAGQCYDKPGPAKGKKTERTCRFVADGRLNLCIKKQVRKHCPVTCESTCPKCKDSNKKVVKVRRKQKEKCEYLNTVSEEDFEKFCGWYVVSTKCPVTCGTCLDGCKDNPNKFKYNGQRTSCEEGEDDWCNNKKSKFAKNCKKKCGICIIVPPFAPSPAPTPEVTGSPTKTPTSSTAPTKTSTSPAPTKTPTKAPTKEPTTEPDSTPTKTPSVYTPSPISAPSSAPSDLPVNGPTSPPTALPTASPTAAPSSPPTSVVGARSVFIGQGFCTFVTYNNGNLKAAGRNSHGQFGINLFDTVEPVPRDVSLLPGSNIVDTGNWHTCVLNNGGDMFCMGKNYRGQLGIGSSGSGSYSSPQQVTSLSGVTSISTGQEHTCAIAQNVLWCWGLNDKGQNGNGSLGVDNVSPVQVNTSAFPGVTPVSVSCGGLNTCALFSDNKVRCWGLNHYGEIGADPDTTEYSTVPLEVNFPVGSATPRDVSCGSLHTCALMSDNTISCWGDNHFGQLGTGTIGGNFYIPQSTAVINNAVSIVAGTLHSCALLSDKTLHCWGNNHFGQLGLGNNNDLATPTHVPLSLDVENAAVGGASHTCAVLVDRSVWCWGRNSDGQLGLGNTGTMHNSPVETLF